MADVNEGIMPASDAPQDVSQLDINGSKYNLTDTDARERITTLESKKGDSFYQGTGITGTSTTAAVFSGSGVASAEVGDSYLNPTTGYVYKCTVAGNPSTAKWVYTGSLKGPVGATGAPGATGATGATGPQGPAGSDATIPYLVGSGTATANIVNSAIALGNGANATSKHSIAIGVNAITTTEDSTYGSTAVALGYYSKANSGLHSAAIALGDHSNANGDDSVSLGYYSNSDNCATALGGHASAFGYSSVSIGQSSNSNKRYSIAIGWHSQANMDKSIVIGYYSNASLVDPNDTNIASSIAIGTEAVVCSRGDSVVIGNNAITNGRGSIALGWEANVTGDTAIAIGVRASCNGASSTSGQDSIAIGHSATTEDGQEAVAIGMNAHGLAYSSITIGTNATAGRPNAISIGTNAHTWASGAIAIGYQTISDDGSIALGDHASINAENSIAIGPYASVKGKSNSSSDTLYYSIAIGDSASARLNRATALGKGACVNGVGGTALGASTFVNNSYSTALGFGASTSNVESIQLGSSSCLSSITAKVSITVTSDERDKTDIEDIPNKATEFLKKVRAVTFVYNQRELYRPQEPEVDEDGNPIIEDGVDYLTDEDQENLFKYGSCRYDVDAHKAGSKKGSRRRVGFLAQDVLKAEEEVFGSTSIFNLVNDNFFDRRANGEEIPEGVESTLAMNYEGFIPILAQAFKELEARMTKQEQEIAALKHEIAVLKGAQ